ncbi:hypothetical protein HYV98_00295 [Candidatus Azambacteria bacterium]|nr:hypothetical protein [Candidatus Azambacteria bacterium]
MRELLRRFFVASILESGAKRKAKFFETLEEAIAEEETPRLLSRPGTTLELDSGVRLEVLAPAEDVAGKVVENSNNLSVVSRLRVGARSVLLMGDAEKEEEAEVLARLPRPRVDVLKVGHHGSRTSSSAAFLQATRPRIALISVGRNNPYGHPHSEVLQQFSKIGSAVYRTDELGDIRVRTTGYMLTVE